MFTVVCVLVPFLGILAVLWTAALAEARAELPEQDLLYTVRAHTGGYLSMDVGLYPDRLVLATFRIRTVLLAQVSSVLRSGQELILSLQDGSKVTIYFPYDLELPSFLEHLNDALTDRNQQPV